MRSSLTALLLVFSAMAGHAQPIAIHSIDPLTQPPPELSEPLLLAKDDKLPSEKITPLLWERLAAAKADEQIRVLVLLHEPVLERHLVPATPEWDAARVPRLAVLQHEFAARAMPLGFSSARGFSHLPVVAGTIPPEAARAIAALAEVRAIEEERVFHAARAQGAALMNADDLRTSFGGGGNGVGVAVLDSGVDNSHPELASRVVAQGDYTNTTGNGAIDDNGHGTAVAGIIAGTSGGVAPQATIWAIKVLNASGVTVGPSVIDGLNAIYASRNDFGGLDLVNMSLGGGGPHNSDCDGISPVYFAAVNQLVAAGIAVFAASGNESSLNGISLPACFSSVISVGAVFDASFFSTSCGEQVSADQITCYSNSGIPLDILAPSECAVSPLPGGGYNQCFTGTSAAAPYAAGVAAQILSLRPGTSPAALRNALMTTGRPRTDVNNITRNRIDAVQAYQALASATGPCVPDADTLCIDGAPGDGRFKLEIDWRTAQANGVGGAVPMSSLGISKGGAFWFFNPANPEMLIKVLNGCPLTNTYWVFFAATTNVEFTLRVTDTQRGVSKTYSNPLNHPANPIQDTAALPTCP